MITSDKQYAAAKEQLTMLMHLVKKIGTILVVISSQQYDTRHQPQSIFRYLNAQKIVYFLSLTHKV